MTARSHDRGHDVEFQDGWHYSDTGDPANDDRPCERCEQPPTPEGHDACLGKLWATKSACCGHGVEPGYVMRTMTGRIVERLVRFWTSL